MTSREELEELMFSLQYGLETKEDLERILEIKNNIIYQNNFCKKYFQTFINVHIERNLNKYLKHFNNNIDKKKEFENSFIGVEELINQIKKKVNNKELLNLYFTRLYELSVKANYTFNFQGWKYGITLLFDSTFRDKGDILNKYSNLIGNRKQMKYTFLRHYFLVKYSYNAKENNINCNYQDKIVSDTNNQIDDSLLNNHIPYNYKDTILINEIIYQEDDIESIPVKQFKNTKMLLNINDTDFKLSIKKHINWYFLNSINEKVPIDDLPLLLKNDRQLYDFIVKEIKPKNEENNAECLDLLFQTMVIKNVNTELLDVIIKIENQTITIKRYRIKVDPNEKIKEIKEEIENQPELIISHLSYALHYYLLGESDYSSQIRLLIPALYKKYSKVKTISIPAETCYCLLILRIRSRTLKKEEKFRCLTSINKDVNQLFQIEKEKEFDYHSSMVKKCKKKIRNESENSRYNFIFGVINCIYNYKKNEKKEEYRILELIRILQIINSIEIKDIVLLQTIKYFIDYSDSNEYVLPIFLQLSKYSNLLFQSNIIKHKLHDLLNCFCYNVFQEEYKIFKEKKEFFTNLFLQNNDIISQSIWLIVQCNLFKNEKFTNIINNNANNVFMKYIDCKEINLKFSLLYCCICLKNEALFRFFSPFLSIEYLNQKILIELNNDNQSYENHFKQNKDYLCFHQINNIDNIEQLNSIAQKNSYINRGIAIFYSNNTQIHNLYCYDNMVWFNYETQLIYLKDKQTIYDYINKKSKNQNYSFVFLFEKINQNNNNITVINEETLVQLFLDYGIKTNQLLSFIFPYLLFKLLLSHLELLSKYKDILKEYTHSSTSNAKWAIKVFKEDNISQKDKKYYKDIYDVLVDLKVDKELKENYSALLTYLNSDKV